jgi:sterol desaturase/sphingolipid hydroxylase (fatty acid hydroxylase superfamily)
MNNIVQYFEQVPDSHRIILLGICLFFFGNLELLFSIKANTRKINHIITNALFMIPAAPVQMGIGYLLILLIRETSTHKIGLLYLLPDNFNPLLYFLFSFLLLDFFEYVYHVTMHKVKRLWMIHLVHHSDRALTVTTTLREHPMETLTRLLFLVLWVAISGISFWALLFRQFIQIVSNVFAHANIRLSEPMDRVFSFVLVTPNMHQVHHHYQQPYTDSNYGDVLSIWDRLFGTFAIAKAEELEFGIDTCFDKKENAHFPALLMIPFGEYRKSNQVINMNEVELEEEEHEEEIINSPSELIMENT